MYLCIQYSITSNKKMLYGGDFYGDEYAEYVDFYNSLKKKEKKNCFGLIATILAVALGVVIGIIIGAEFVGTILEAIAAIIVLAVVLVLLLILTVILMICCRKPRKYCD